MKKPDLHLLNTVNSLMDAVLLTQILYFYFWSYFTEAV